MAHVLNANTNNANAMVIKIFLCLLLKFDPDVFLTGFVSSGLEWFRKQLSRQPTNHYCESVFSCPCLFLTSTGTCKLRNTEKICRRVC